MMTTDTLLVIATLLLALTALVAPYVSEYAKRSLFKPKLKILFKLSPPSCHKTRYTTNLKDPDFEAVYFVRFEVENIGKSTCNNVENAIENIWKSDASGKFIQIEDFTPVNLLWSIKPQMNRQFINPNRKFYCNIGHLPSRDYQKVFESNLICPKGYTGDDLKFVLDLETVLNAQLCCLPPGSFIIQVNTYSENHHTIKNYFRIDWNGKWNDEINLMFQNLVVSKVDKP